MWSSGRTTGATLPCPLADCDSSMITMQRRGPRAIAGQTRTWRCWTARALTLASTEPRAARRRFEVRVCTGVHAGMPWSLQWPQPGREFSAARTDSRLFPCTEAAVTRLVGKKSVCVCVCVFLCLRACVLSYVFACVLSCVLACVRLCVCVSPFRLGCCPVA